MEELIKWIVGGGMFAGAGAIITAYFSGRKTVAEANAIQTKADTEKHDADSKRQIEEKDAVLRQMYEYIAHVKEWVRTAHDEMQKATLERDGDRRNLEDVKAKFDKLDRDYQDVRVELGRERANNARLIQEKIAVERERDEARAERDQCKARLGEVER